MDDEALRELSGRVDALLTVAAMAIEMSGRSVEGIGRLATLEEEARKLNWPPATIETLRKVRLVLLADLGS